MTLATRLMLVLSALASLGCSIVADLGPEPNALPSDAGGATIQNDAGCSVISHAEDATSSWNLIGDAELRPGYIQLTADTAGRAGALLWSAPIALDTFDVTFEISITSANSEGFGSGLAFVALSTALPPCEVRRSVCVFQQGIEGFGMNIATTDWGNGIEPPFVAFVDASTDPITAANWWTPVPPTSVITPLPSIDDTTVPPEESWHDVRVRAADGRVMVYFDGASKLNEERPGGGSPMHWGFSGSTDELGRVSSQRNAIRNVVMTLPGNGCVP